MVAGDVEDGADVRAFQVELRILQDGFPEEVDDRNLFRRRHGGFARQVNIGGQRQTGERGHGHHCTNSFRNSFLVLHSERRNEDRAIGERPTTARTPNKRGEKTGVSASAQE